MAEGKKPNIMYNEIDNFWTKIEIDLYQLTHYDLLFAMKLKVLHLDTCRMELADLKTRGQEFYDDYEKWRVLQNKIRRLSKKVILLEHQKHITLF